ncbi:MAG: HEAT repeat domain-containing protein [Planctomycetota bacterium]|jgi:HEAT repeat protein
MDTNVQVLVQRILEHSTGMDEAREAARELAALGSAAAQAVPALLAALDDEELWVAVVEALGILGPHAAGAVPALEDLLSRRIAGNEGDAGHVAEALGKIGPEAHPAVPLLIEALEQDPDDNRPATALGGIGPAAAPAIPILVQGLKEDSISFPSGLAGIGKAAVPALREVLGKSTDQEELVNATLALKWMGPDAEEAVPELVAALDSGSEYLRRDAAEALGGIGPSATAAVPALVGMVEERDEYVRREVATALWAIGARQEAMSFMVENLGCDVEGVGWSRAARDKLREIGSPAVPALLKGLEHSNWEVRFWSLELLKEIAPKKVPRFLRLRKWLGRCADWLRGCFSRRGAKPMAAPASRCDACSRRLERYEGRFGGMTGQLGGVRCPSCQTTWCDTCHPPSRGQGCPECGAALEPAFAR